MAQRKSENLEEYDAKSQGEIDNVVEDKHILEQKQQILNNSGILQAYEYFLRKLCKEGFPQGNALEYAAQQVLKYEKKKKAEQFRQQTTKKSLAELQLNERLKVQYGLQQDNEKGVSKSPAKVGKDGKDAKNAKDTKGQKQDIKKDDKNVKKEAKKETKKEEPKDTKTQQKKK